MAEILNHQRARPGPQARLDDMQKTAVHAQFDMPFQVMRPAGQAVQIGPRQAVRFRRHLKAQPAAAGVGQVAQFAVADLGRGDRHRHRRRQRRQTGQQAGRIEAIGGRLAQHRAVCVGPAEIAVGVVFRRRRRAIRVARPGGRRKPVDGAENLDRAIDRAGR